MGNELTGIRSGDGAKMKAEVGEDTVTFRGAIKAEVPFEEIVAEARGTLLVLSFRGNIVEVGAGARAAQLAARIRSPPSRMDRLGVLPGQSAAVAGVFDTAFRAEVAARATIAPGAPREPVDHLFLAIEDVAGVAAVAKVAPLVGGSLWVVHAKDRVAPAKIAAAAAAAGLKPRGAAVRFSPGLDAVPFGRK